MLERILLVLICLLWLLVILGAVLDKEKWMN